MWFEIDWARWQTRNHGLENVLDATWRLSKHGIISTCVHGMRPANGISSTFQLGARLGFQLIKTLLHRFKENSKIMSCDWRIILETEQTFDESFSREHYVKSRIWIWNEILRQCFSEGICFNSQRFVNIS